MCTVVLRWAPGTSPLLLAVRDELLSRTFDEPDEWWPEQPGVIGGRDRQAGGSWCVSDVASGVTALVLNRPERTTGTPSRGLLPLLAVQHGEHWGEHVDVATMATFTLLLTGADRVTGWEWDGAQLSRHELPAGLHVLTPRGIDPGDPRSRRLAPLASARPWKQILGEQAPSDAEDAFVVRHDTEHGAYGTVFAQVISARPGRLHIESTRSPWDEGTWRTREWGA